MKRFFSVALVMGLVLALVVPAAAANTAPAWVTAEEYVTLTGDVAYGAPHWENILKLREDAAAGKLQPNKKGETLYALWNSGEGLHTSPALRFELGLIGMQYGANAKSGRATSGARRYFSLAMGSYVEAGGSKSDKAYQVMQLWYYRARLLECTPTSNQEFSVKALETFLQEAGYTMEDFLSYKPMAQVTEAEWARFRKIEADKEAAFRAFVGIEIDGTRLSQRELGGAAVIRSGRTMVPIRAIAERLGAKVEWVSATRSARITRNDMEILMPIGKTVATVNGKPVQMDVAPYVEEGRTMLPVRYVAEFFGQNVKFNSETRYVEITEDKSVAGNSNLEAWAIPMGAILHRQQNLAFGRNRGGNYSPLASGDFTTCEMAKKSLGEGWDIHSRAELIDTIATMTGAGHNVNFLTDVAFIKSLSDQEYRQMLASAQGMDKYMFPYTKALGEKWGERGLLCWDLFRMSNLCQWGYEAGYLSYGEALAMVEPAAKLLQANFKSWDEAYENYLDGYNWWDRTDLQGKSVWETMRGREYRDMKQSKGNGGFFDDSLFRAAPVGVPGITAAAIIQENQSK